MTALYARVLGSVWHDLPDQLRSMHDVTATSAASGAADVERGRGRLARVIASVMRLPGAGTGIPLRVCFSVTKRGERWDRDFGGRQFASTQALPRNGREGDGLIEECIGPATLVFRLAYDGSRLRILPIAWRVFGIPMPARHAPVRAACEWVDAEGRFAFDVEVAHPWTGLIVRYSGWLVRTS